MPPQKPSAAEGLKSSSNYLRGPLAEEMRNDTDVFSRTANGLLKFHGIYQQDDRDLRKASPEKVYSSMVRVGIAGGVVSAEQYLTLDALADSAGDGSLRVTSRQDVQYHYVGKRNLKALISAVNGAGLSTLAACGDVVRNVTCDTTPVESAERGDLLALARRVRESLKPRTGAYAEIWLDGEKAASLTSGEEEEPLYGATYLPRKFKIAFTFEGENLIDIYSNDLGFVPHYEGGVLAGFTVLAGGGMGQSNGVKGSHPRMADPVGFIGASEELVLAVAKAAVAIHRDFGNRENRRLARLKYVLDERGVEWFRGELEARIGWRLAPPRELTWRRQEDYLGWHRQGEERWFFGLRVVSGRLKGGVRQAVCDAVKATGCEVRFTVQQNLLLAGLSSEGRTVVGEILRRHGVPMPMELPPVLRHSMACVSLPTCGQAITESERVLPQVADDLQKELDTVGLDRQIVHVRMTGCPNGCARPYTAEIGIVGESVGLYTIYLGGSPRADRLARAWKRLVPLAGLGEALRPLFGRYASERASGEAFGDWCERQLEWG
ncbi:MAG: NADPH-dependent assimilatory sulfite reductase hemoprotein subunit [Acidobacteria bacterium]|nr:NADPH-dependent assimilatory sulfite reductase hemoprotein subunit [Acidobacteriota bacterium]